MGRPKKEKPQSSKERVQNYRSDPAKRSAENQRKRDARKNKATSLSEEELKIKREKEKERKAKSRKNRSRQKIVGTRIKDQNRKSAAVGSEENESDSAKRVRKHRALKVAFNFTRKNKKVTQVTDAMNRSLSNLSPQSKVKAISQSCSKSLSPASNSILAETVSEEVSNPLLDVFNSLKRKRDSASNCARRLVLNKLSTKLGSANKVRRSNRSLRWTSLQQATRMEVDEIIIHYKTTKSTTPKPPTETVKKVNDFYNQDTISRQLPYKNFTRKIKDCMGVYHRVPVRVMEVTLKKAFHFFRLQHPDVKMSRRSFECLRPKNFRLRRYAQRLQCCCTYHTNIDYIRKACNNLFSVNGKVCPFPNNDTLIQSALCNPNSLKCILRVCPNCKTFSQIDDLHISSLKCSKSCIKENNDCAKHTIKVKQFERVTYIHKEQEKKKLQLLDKMLTPSELVDLLKNKLKQFPQHRFNVQQTAKTYDNIVANLDENSILKIHDFSENYTCLLPEEIQSIHWTQEQATVYPIVVLRKVGEDIREDHLVFVSEDRKHDVPFVELCNDILHKHYQDNGMTVTHDIEYNDGCASQFKCIRAFSSLSRRKIKTTRVFCETSHGKSKSDGLGGVVKSYASRAVCGERMVIRNAKELFDFFNDNLLVQNAIESNRPMLNRLFFYVSSEDIDNYRSAFPVNEYNFIAGTLKIHEVTTIPGNDKAVYYRYSSCGCQSCFNCDYNKCESIEQFKEYPKNIQMTQHNFTTSKKKKKNQKRTEEGEESDTDLNEDEAKEWEEAFVETEASKYIQEGDFAVIKTGDDHPYYLLKLTSAPFETASETTDDYKHTFPAFHRVVQGNYLEFHKETMDGNVYYIDYKHTALISAFCIVGNCPTPPTITEKKRGKDVEMLLIDNDLHQTLSELVNTE